MTDYMKEAERLSRVLEDIAQTALRGAENEQIRGHLMDAAEMLAHIQRGAVPEGWKVRRDRGAIVVEHPKVGGYAATADSESIASTILYEFANAMLAAAPAPDQFRGAAKMVPVHCTPTEHEGRIVYEHTSEPIPNADGFVLYAASADRFRAAAKMMAVQPSCMTCNGHGMVGGRLPSGGGYQADQCPDCTASVPAEVPVPESIERLAITRYRTRPKGMFGCEVVAGDGSRSLFEGSRTECCSIARKLTEAFLDGAHIAIANFISASGVEEHNHTQAEVPMPEPVAYGIGNTAITGHTNRLMMVRLAVPLDDQYAGAYWLPLVLADEAHTYGAVCRAAGEAAGYARGLADERERCASVAWAHYMDTCRRKGIGPDVLPDWCCAAALRGEVK